MTTRRYYTTHQVADILGVSLPTVVNWIKAGRLQAHKTPGGHRRISPISLAMFAQEFNYPVPSEIAALAVSDGPCVLVVDTERALAETLRDYLEMKSKIEVLVADTAFRAGYWLGSRRPSIVLLDLAMPDLDMVDVVQVIRSRSPTTKVFATYAYQTPAMVREKEEAGFDGSFEKPVPLDQLSELLELG